MTRPLDFVCLMPSDWGRVRSNPDYTVLGLLERGHRVLAVEPLQTLSSLVRMARWQKTGIRRNSGLRQEGERFWAYAPLPVGVPGLSRVPVLARISGAIFAPMIRAEIARLGFRDPVLWSFMYTAGSVLTRMDAALKIYECGDEDAALADSAAQRRTVEILEAEVLRAADLAFCVTEELSIPRRRHNTATHTVNCAADVAFFGRARDPATPVPPAIAALAHPVIGYVGGLDPWKIDVELIRAIAAARPGWSIALVGFVWFGFDPSVFAGLSNVHVLGPQPYDDLPGFMKGMDVALMPFPLNDITRNGDALKAYEYLAAGLPVVSRDVPVARRLAGAVRMRDTAAEFIEGIEAALAEPASARPDLAALAAAHDWSVRVAEKLAHIDRALAARTAG